METAFDTLTAARGLESAGFDRPQAEALASAVRSGHGGLVTKQAPSSGLAGLTPKDDVASLKSDLTDRLASRQRRYVGLPLAAAGLAVAAVKLL